MESKKGNMVSLQTFQIYETNNEVNDTQHLNKTTILCPLYLSDINDCFRICSKHTTAQKLKFLDNITSLSRHKVSFIHAKMTSNILQCLHNELQ